MILQVYYNVSSSTRGIESEHTPPEVERVLMNSIFHPDDNIAYMDSGQNQSDQLQVSTWTNMEIQLVHFIFINLMIVLPPFLHVVGACRISRIDICSKFIVAVSSGCFFSFILGTKALTLTLVSRNEDDITNICLSYVTTDNIVLAGLILSACLYNVTANRTSVCFHNSTKLLLWIWFAVAIVMHVMSFVMTTDVAQCGSSTMHVADDIRIYMPMVRNVDDSTLRIVMSAVLYLPPVLVIIISGHRWRYQNGNIADHKPVSSDMMISTHRTCMVCVRTLTHFDVWWWRTLLCLLLGVVRPCLILGNWFWYSEFMDIPPVVVIVLVFYPMCVAQTINYFRCVYTRQQSRIFHI